MRDPYLVEFSIRKRQYSVSVRIDLRFLEGQSDHSDPFPSSERVLASMTVMRASNDYDKLVDLAEDVLYSLEMAEVEWLEPADVEAGRQFLCSVSGPNGLRGNLVPFDRDAFSFQKVPLDLAAVIRKRATN